jgi:hypothetical protein
MATAPRRRQGVCMYIDIFVNTRTSMFGPVLQKFWAKKNLEKSLLISTLDKVIYFI